jgi:hypothetical protein
LAPKKKWEITSLVAKTVACFDFEWRQTFQRKFNLAVHLKDPCKYFKFGHGGRRCDPRGLERERRMPHRPTRPLESPVGVVEGHGCANRTVELGGTEQPPNAEIGLRLHHSPCS